MAPLKFRAWDNKNKKWLLGYDMSNLGGFSLFGECMMFGEWSAVLNSFFHAGVGSDDLMVDQSTGLKDSRGVEIFEGDIVNSWDGYPFIVEYFEGAFHAVHPDYGGPLLCGMEVLILGNIHENPELLP